MVEPVPPEEVDRFDELLARHHYLKDARLVGKHLRYVATYRGQWLGLAAWSAAALHLKARDQFIGWPGEQRRTRLPLLVNNSRLLVLPEGQCPNLISRFMKLMLGRLVADWQQTWGHPVALAETYAATLSPGQSRAPGFRTSRHTGRIRCPGESTFKRLLPRVDAAALERALLRWQEQVLSPAPDKLSIVDGKTLRHAHVELVSAVDGRGRWLGTVPVPEGSNEIPAARELLAKVTVANKTALADALHTQIGTA